MLGDAAPTPVFSGSCTVSGFLPRSSITTPHEPYSFPAALFTPIGIIMCIPIDPKGERVAFGVSEALEEKNGRQGWSEYEETGAAARVAKANYADMTTQPLRSIMDNFDERETRLWAPYSIPDLPTWHTDRVCLIGDAAHALPPNGQGSAMAFEDAGVLVRLLGASESWGRDTFEQFQTVRRKRVEYVKRISKGAGGAKGKTGPWMWWLKQWGIWAFFAWNRWEIRDTRLFGYDVDAEDIGGE